MRSGIWIRIHAIEVSPQTLHAKATFATIAGQVSNESNGKGVPRVKVQLLDSTGTLAKPTVKNGKGVFRFNVSSDGTYVVREVFSSHLTQVSPTAPGFLPNNGPVQPTDGRQLDEFIFKVNVAGQVVSELAFTIAPTASSKSARA